MTSSEIQNRIRYNEELIAQNRVEVNRLYAKISELEALRSKVAGLQSEFAEKQIKRRTKLGNVTQFSSMVKIARSYASGMNELLNGSEYHRAYNGLSEGIDRINRKIQELEEQARQLNSEIAVLKNLNANLFDEMQYADEA